MSEATTQLIRFQLSDFMTAARLREVLEGIAGRPLAPRVSIEVDMVTGAGTAYVIFAKSKEPATWE